MVFRTLGLWSVLIAVLMLVIDGTKSFKDEEGWATTTLAEQWNQMSATGFANFRTMVEEQLGSGAWEYGVLMALQIPTWVFFAALGALFYWAGRRRHRIEVFSN